LSVATVPMPVLQNFTRRSALGLALVLLAAAAFAGLVTLVQLGWPPLERFDAAIANTVESALALTPLVVLFSRWLRSRVPGTPAALDSSFPSGHAVNATVFYGALLLVFPAVIPEGSNHWRSSWTWPRSATVC
jgi:membrane-associated phospholipid phosphatase